jgi:putative hemolysin
MINNLSDYILSTDCLNQSVKEKTIRTKLQKKHTVQLNKIAEPVNPELLEMDIDELPDETLLFKKGSFSVFCCKSCFIPNILREIGRLREITFRAVGEGTNNLIDLDRFDSYYYHLFVWDNKNKKIVGAYRIGKGKEVMKKTRKNGFYVSSHFRIKNEFSEILESSLELGRSFIVREYQKHHFSLLLLWKGIFSFMQKNPEYKYIVGSVSISRFYSFEARSLIIQFIRKYFFDEELSSLIKPTIPFRIPNSVRKKNEHILEKTKGNLKTFESSLNSLQPGFHIPVLLKKYLKMNGKIIGFNINDSFNNCLDLLMIAEINNIPFEMRLQLLKDTVFPTDNHPSAITRFSKIKKAG